MNFIKDFLNSGTVKQQNRKKLGALVVCITAALLAIALIVLAVAAIAGAIKNKNLEAEGEGTANKIPSGYVTTTLDTALSSQGLLLVLDADHPYPGKAALVDFPAAGSADRAHDEEGGVVYSGASNKKAIAEAVVAFNQMTQAFYDAKKDNNLYINSVDESGAIFALGYYEYYNNSSDYKLADSIYNTEEKKPVEIYQWLYDNAATYGFVRASDVEGEENVFRYIGTLHAQAMTAKKLDSFAEYIKYIQEKTSVRSQLGVSVENAEGKTVKYGIYYIAPDAEEQYVPEEGTLNYTVCGDNMGGYIVTVEKTKPTKTDAK